MLILLALDRYETIEMNPSVVILLSESFMNEKSLGLV